MKKNILILLAIVSCISLSACAGGIPPQALQLSEDSMELRQLQTRSFNTSSEKKLLVAGANVLQDLGYKIDESEMSLGVIVASKDRDATEAGQVAAAILVAAMGGGSMAIDKNQKIKASLVTKPVKKGETNLRITIQRLVWNSYGQISKVQSIEEPEIYQDFFSKLSKSVFLDANQI